MKPGCGRSSLAGASSGSSRARWALLEQVDAFAAAQVVVAPHGAALGNLVFCPPGVRVLELFAPRDVNPATG